MDGRIESLQFILHLFGHFVVPFMLAWAFVRSDWLPFGGVMVAANVIDVDHFWASPIYDPDRCSIGFHFLHGWEAGLVYAALLCIPRWWTRAFGAGALWHLGVDASDCLTMGAG